MQLICISRGSFSAGKQLAEVLAEKLGFDCLAREELTDEATRAGIPVGKLEMTVARRRPLDERLAIERERYKAFFTAALTERALKGSLVYHGRTGHLVLPGITHVLRVRAISDLEQRIASTMQRLGLTRPKARQYIEEVDEDRHRWIRTLYNVDWHDPKLYDMVVNLSHLSPDNAATGLISMAQLPEFQITPAARQNLEDLLLASRCRLALGTDARTSEVDLQVHAERGRVSIAYPPRHRDLAELFPEVLRPIEGVIEILSTMATTNMLWIQSDFSPKEEALEHILDLSARWNAAVEMIRLTDGPDEAAQGAGEREQTGQDQPEQEVTEQEQTRAEESADGEKAENGGILDDSPDLGRDLTDQEVVKTRARLITAGRAGGFREVHGTYELLGGLERSASYSLVVVGDVYPSKDASLRKRLKRELVGNIADNLRAPVIGSEELKAQYLFGPAQWLRLIVTGLLATAIVLIVLHFQVPILTFLQREQTADRILAAVTVFVCVPIFAFIYGSFGSYLLRLFRFQ